MLLETEFEVYLLSTDFDVNVIDKSVTNVSSPRNTSSSKSWKIDLKVSFPDKVTISGDCARNFSRLYPIFRCI